MPAFGTGHPGVTTSINQAGLAESFDRFLRESRKIKSGDITHQVTIGKSCDGMNGFFKSVTTNGGSSRATGLLAGLLSRI